MRRVGDLWQTFGMFWGLGKSIFCALTWHTGTQDEDSWGLVECKRCGRFFRAD